MRRSLPSLLPLVLPLLVAGVARAGGPEIAEQGSCVALAGACSAKADDPSAIFYNPAGIALRPGAGALVGVTLATADSRATSIDLGGRGVQAAVTGAVLQPRALPWLFASTHLGRRVAVGVGLFSQFAGGVEWPSTAERPFPGRFVSRNDQLSTYTINPTVAFRPIDVIGIGVGLDVVAASLLHERSLHLGDGESVVQLAGNAVGFGFNCGALVDLVPRHLSASLTYRSRVDLDFALRAHFIDPPPSLQGIAFDQPARLSMPLPHHLTFGFATRPGPWLNITTDVRYAVWSDLKTSDITFPSGKTPSLRVDRNWRDSVSLRIGIEAEVWRELVVRVGLGYDFTPIPAEALSPATLGADRMLVGGGLGYSWRGFSVSLSYLAQVAFDRTSGATDFPASYHQIIHLAAIGVGYQTPVLNR